MFYYKNFDMHAVYIIQSGALPKHSIVFVFIATTTVVEVIHRNV